ncbi:MAG: hypothetical protein LLF94_12030 [Chlamydiales bacterium]|nr:hypothetical protein [Chlamydiales bacterium]
MQSDIKGDILFDILFDKRRQEYLNESRKLFNSYMQKPKQCRTNTLLSFSCWKKASEPSNNGFSYQEHQALFDAKNSDIQTGGYFITLNQKGICINPDAHFFEEFCQKGYSLQDIDVVIATHNSSKVLEGIMRFGTLCREYSRTLISYGQDPHVIRYFLHPELFASVSIHFRPTIRQEVGSVLSLETFTNSIEVRQIDEALTLHYAKDANSNLGFRIDSQCVSLGFMANGGYHSVLENLFLPITVLIGGIGLTPATDLEKVELQVDHLGYYGLHELINNAPSLQLALVSEFSRSMGDCRLELIQKLRQDVVTNAKILPLDSNFSLHLDDLVIGTQSQNLTTLDDVRVVRPAGPFGQLHFLDKADVL